MKRTVTGIAAAALALGMMAPAAFAATTSASSTVKWNAIKITASNYSVAPEGFAGYDHNSTTMTTFAPVYYVQQALNALGYTVTWDGSDLHVTTPSGITPNYSNISVGTGDTGSYVNGTLVKNVFKKVAKDPLGGKSAQETTYVPIFYINALLQAAGETATWNGSGWAMTAPVSTQAPFGVASASVINAKQFQVKFTQPASSSNNFAGVTLTAQGTAQAPGSLSYSLSTDGKTLTVTTTSTLTNNGYYAIGVSGVQDNSLDTLTPYSQVVQLSDSVAPSVVSTKAVTNQSSTTTFTLNFSEPAQFDLVKVGSVVASAVPTDSTYTSYTVTVPTADAMNVNQNYGVTIQGLRDFAGNYAASTVSTSVTPLQDTVALKPPNQVGQTLCYLAY